MLDWALWLSRAMAAHPKQAPQRRPLGHSRNLHPPTTLGQRRASCPSRQQEPPGSSRYSNLRLYIHASSLDNLSAVKGFVFTLLSDADADCAPWLSLICW